MDTGSSTNKTAGLGAKSQNGSNTNVRQTCEMQEQLENSLNDVRADILSWMYTAEEDKDRCFDLLQQMELVDEVDQNTSYDCDLSTHQVEQEPVDESLISKRESEGVVCKEEGDIKK